MFNNNTVEVNVIESTYVRKLIMTVINNSESDNWQEAVTEWEIYDWIQRVCSILWDIRKQELQ